MTGGERYEAGRGQRYDCNNVPAIVPGVGGACERNVDIMPAYAPPASR